VTRVRLRPRYSDEELSRIYATPHSHSRWADHLLRVQVTASLAQWVADQHGCTSAADLSCGDGTILESLEGVSKTFGDYAPGYLHRGPIEETLEEIGGVDLFICSETIEHLDDPDTVLRRIHGRAHHLIVSTPINEADDGNPEHYWGWGVDDVKGLLLAAGWEPHTTIELKLRPRFTYDFQIHACWRSR
jgi:hypothetical protein